MAAAPRLVLVLSENWTMVSPRDLKELVRIAQEAEDAGIDGVMLSEHIVLGPAAGALGRPDNPRDYAAPGNQDPATPWPDSIVLMSAIASVTTRLRLIAAAIIAPLRHPLLLAHQLAALDLLSEGRLVVQPTVSWHRDEYAALGVPFERRGALLDEHLAAWRTLWRDTPADHPGPAYPFESVYLEPKPFRGAEGPRLWFGGMSVGPWIIRRLVEYGHGFHPFGQPTAEEMAPLHAALRAAGRDPADLEVVGGIRGDLKPGGVADLDQAAAAIPAQLEAGYTTICFKPSQFTDDPAQVGDLCRRLVALSSR